MLAAPEATVTVAPTTGLAEVASEAAMSMEVPMGMAVETAPKRHSLPLPSSTPAGTTPGQASDSSYPMIPPMSTY